MSALFEAMMAAMLLMVLPTLATGTIPSMMKAAVASGTAPMGDFSKVSIVDHKVPSPGPGELLIQVNASSVNPVDWKIIETNFDESTVNPLHFPHVLGFDVSGVVVKVGEGCSRLKVGDAVWADLGKLWPLRGGGELGAYAEYALADESQVSIKPEILSFVQAASLPLVALTTLQAYRKAGAPFTSYSNLTVVVTSGSGGTGHVGVQMAKHAYGAKHVIAAAGPDSIDFVKSLGADVVVDYTKENIFDTLANDTVDVVYDNYGAKGTADKALRVLRKGGVFIFLPGKGAAVSKHTKDGVKQINFGLVDSSDYRDLDALTSMVTQGQLKPHVQEIFTLDDLVSAFNVSLAGKVVGKLGIQI